MLFVIWLCFGVVILFYILEFWSSRINGTGLYLVQEKMLFYPQRLSSDAKERLDNVSGVESIELVVANGHTVHGLSLIHI